MYKRQVTHLARGDVALSITLTGVTSMIAALTLPLVVNASLHLFMPASTAIEFSMTHMIGRVFVLTTVPVVVGMLLRMWRPQAVKRADRLCGRVATALFVFIVFATFWDQRQVLMTHMAGVGPAALLLNASVLAGAWGLSQYFSLTAAERSAIVTAVSYTHLDVYKRQALAWADGFAKHWAPALVALACAVLIQIGTNLHNDVRDFERGNDRPDRVGPLRVTAAARVSTSAMHRATALTRSLIHIYRPRRRKQRGSGETIRLRLRHGLPRAPHPRRRPCPDASAGQPENGVAIHHHPRRPRQSGQQPPGCDDR